MEAQLDATVTNLPTGLTVVDTAAKTVTIMVPTASSIQ
jgi:hypothetical protein